MFFCFAEVFTSDSVTGSQDEKSSSSPRHIRTRYFSPERARERRYSPASREMAESGAAVVTAEPEVLSVPPEVPPCEQPEKTCPAVIIIASISIRRFFIRVSFHQEIPRQRMSFTGGTTCRKCRAAPVRQCFFAFAAAITAPAERTSIAAQTDTASAVSGVPGVGAGFAPRVPLKPKHPGVRET